MASGSDAPTEVVDPPSPTLAVRVDVAEGTLDAEIRALLLRDKTVPSVCRGCSLSMAVLRSSSLAMLAVVELVCDVVESCARLSWGWTSPS